MENKKHFALIITYACGQCVYLTERADIAEAINDFRVRQRDLLGYKDSKSFDLPEIISAKLLRVVY